VTDTDRLALSPAQIRRNVRNLIYHTALAGVIEGGIVTYLPIMLARMGASGTTVSWLNSGMALMTIAMALPTGPIVARQRNLVRFTTIAALGVRLALLAIAGLAALPGEWTPALIVVVWSLHAIPATLVNNAFFGVLARSIPARDRAKVNGARWALFGVLAALSAKLFGDLLGALPFPVGYQIAFAGSAIAGIAGLWFFGRIEIAASDSPPEVAMPILRRAAGLVVPRNVGWPYVEFAVLTTITRLGIHLPIGLFSVYWVQFLGATDEEIGTRSFLANAGLIVGYFGWGWLSARLGHRWTIAVASAGMALFPGITFLGPTPIWMIPAAIAWGVFIAGIDFGFVEGLLRVSPAERRAELVAVHHFQANVVLFAAPLVGAWLAALTDIPTVMLIAVGFHLLTAIVLLATSRRARVARKGTDPVVSATG
jgi:MFS family permease